MGPPPRAGGLGLLRRLSPSLTQKRRAHTIILTEVFTLAIRKLNLSGHDNSHLKEMGYETHKLHVDLADVNLSDKVKDFIINLGVTSEDVVHLAPPGLAPLALIVNSVIHGITGQFPSIVMLKRTDEGFIPLDHMLDLQEIRNISVRPNRIDMFIL